MKKVLFLMLSLVLFCSCHKEKKEVVKQEVFTVENTISSDKEAMYLIN